MEIFPLILLLIFKEDRHRKICDRDIFKEYFSSSPILIHLLGEFIDCSVPHIDQPYVLGILPEYAEAYGTLIRGSKDIRCVPIEKCGIAVWKLKTMYDQRIIRAVRAVHSY